MWGCEDTSECIWTEDISMWDASIQASTHEPKGMSMWGCKDTIKYTQIWGYEDPGMEARAHKPEDMRT